MPAAWAWACPRTRSGSDVDGGNGAHPVPGEVFRGLAGHLPTGVSVVVALVDVEPFAAAAGSVTAASWEPPLLAVFLRSDSRMAAALDRSERFSVNILGETDAGFARRFARPGRGQGWAALADVAVVRRDPAPPILRAAVAWADCLVTRAVSTGDHTCYVGEVIELYRRAEDDPLVYHRGRFRGLGPAVAPADWAAVDAGELAATW